MKRTCVLRYIFWINILLFVNAFKKDRHAIRQILNTNNLSKKEQCAQLEDLHSYPDINCCGRGLSGTFEELDAFPWSALLRATFDNGNSLSVFSCGGSLISQRYVLTAAHCVVRLEETLVSINITLKNYDDCNDSGRLSNDCVDNISVQAEDTSYQPEFNNEKLLHDIALVRLRKNSFSRYITPVCLPLKHLDSPHLDDLPLVVAGWGRDGSRVIDTKQATLVHSMSHHQCHKFYPFLSKSHLCAIGQPGEDTRMGDSGGPLMTLYNGAYYIIGVVSGKRPNNQFKQTMPSLYTNVYRYMHWIKNILNVLD